MNLPRFDSARVLTIGDAMLDRYWHGATSRISAEAPVPVVDVDVGVVGCAVGGVTVSVVVVSTGTVSCVICSLDIFIFLYPFVALI